MKPNKIVLTAAAAAALALAAVGMRHARAPSAVELFSASGATDIKPVDVDLPTARAASPATLPPALRAETAAPPDAAQTFSAAPDLGRPTEIEALVVPNQPHPPQKPSARNPGFKPMDNVSGYLSQSPRQTAAFQAAAPSITGGTALEKLADALAAQAQALAVKAMEREQVRDVPTTPYRRKGAKLPPSETTPQSIAGQAVQLNMLPTSVWGDFHYGVVNDGDRPVDDVQIITPAKTWSLGRLAPGQTAQIDTAEILIQVKVRYINPPQ